MTGFEDKLRERPESLLAQRPPAVPVSVAERDALADAVEALRKIAEYHVERTITSNPIPGYVDGQPVEIVYVRTLRANEIATAALARLDAV